MPNHDAGPAAELVIFWAPGTLPTGTARAPVSGTGMGACGWAAGICPYAGTCSLLVVNGFPESVSRNMNT